MTRDELLEKLKLTDRQLKDLLAKFEAFQNDLDADQLKVLKRSLPTLCEALSWLGPHATEDQLRELFGGGHKGHKGPPIIVCHFAGTDRP
jgi:hypothetical protein